jgi:hypothetical protein
MSTNTPNYNLVKPQDTDNADLKIFVGQNMDTIDTTLANKLDKTVMASPTQLGLVKVGSGLSIDAQGVLTASGGGGGGAYLPLTGGALTGPLTINGLTVPTLDANGSNNNPTNSAFRATAPGTQALAASAVTKLTYNTEEYDIQSEFDTTLSRFTAKAQGVYMISCCMRVGNTTSAVGPQMFITLYKNGAEYTRMQNFVNGALSGSAFQAHGCAVVKLNANDYVEVYGYSTVALTVQNNVGASFFSGVKVG